MVARMVGWVAFVAAVGVLAMRPVAGESPPIRGTVTKPNVDPAALVLTKLGELGKDVDEEQKARAEALSTQKTACEEKETTLKTDVEMKNVKAREVTDGLASKAATIMEADKALETLASERKTSDEKMKLTKGQLDGIMKNIETAKSSHRAAVELHNSSITSLDSAFGQIQQLIQYVQRAYQTQAAANVVNTPGENAAAMNATTAEAARSNPDPTNPKSVGVRGTVAAADQDMRAQVLVAATSKPVEGSEAKESADAKAKLPTQSAMPSFKRVLSELRPEHRSRINPSADQLLALVAQFQATHNRRKLLANAEATPEASTTARNSHQQGSYQMYKLMRELASHIRDSRMAETEAHGKGIDRHAKLIEALTVQRAKLEAAVKHEEAKNFAGKEKALDDKIKGATAARDSLLKQQTGVRQDLELMANALVEQQNKCTALAQRIQTHKETTDGQQNLIKGLTSVISQRVKKMKETLEKNLGEMAHLMNTPV